MRPVKKPSAIITIISLISGTMNLSNKPEKKIRFRLPQRKNVDERKKKGKILALVERLDKYKASVCLFIHNFMVPFDNNQAEHDIRMIKVKTKVSGCFRSEEGARDYLKIMSYVGTAHKQGHNAYDAIRKAVSGCPDFIFD